MDASTATLPVIEAPWPPPSSCLARLLRDQPSHPASTPGVWRGSPIGPVTYDLGPVDVRLCYTTYDFGYGITDLSCDGTPAASCCSRRRVEEPSPPPSGLAEELEPQLAPGHAEELRRHLLPAALKSCSTACFWRRRAKDFGMGMDLGEGGYRTCTDAHPHILLKGTMTTQVWLPLSQSLPTSISKCLV
uniref:Uncharacterized protein n=1 Tax=Oryza rufipogon TaxID=4529 RepID=A0A0E0PRK7_ORYRU